MFKDDSVRLEKKKYGIVKVVDEDDSSKYSFKFDNSIIPNNKKFKAKQEVDVLDKENCYIRATISKIDNDNLLLESNQREFNSSIDNVFNCGEKLPFKTCKSSDSLIKIKFCKGGSDLDICKRLLNFSY